MEMPTAMLGDGATLRNAALERFMCRYNPGHCEKNIEKARMALCIQSEIDQGRGMHDGAVWFDATSLDESTLKGYQTHYRRLVNAGFDPAKDLIPIRPASHSLMGGIKINAHCRSEVDGLFVCGEAAGGVHGASRIAGNGASDVIVFGRIAGLAAAGNRRIQIDTDAAVAAIADPLRPDAAARMSSMAYMQELNRLSVATVRRLMTLHVGIKRSGDGLEQAMALLKGVRKDVHAHWNGSVGHPLTPARNAVLVAMSITGSALRRTESRGAHFRTDHPDTDLARWTRSITIRLDGRGRPCHTD
jgi:succinate dehydrogenase/fumarate reductase flavoprotein subunit